MDTATTSRDVGIDNLDRYGKVIDAIAGADDRSAFRSYMLGALLSASDPAAVDQALTVAQSCLTESRARRAVSA